MRGYRALGVFLALTAFAVLADAQTQYVPSAQPRVVSIAATPAVTGIGSRVDPIANQHGMPYIACGHPSTITRSATVLDSDGAQTNAALIDVGAAFLVITEIDVTANADNTGPVAVRVGLGSASTPSPALGGTDGIVIDHPGIAPGSGIAKGSGCGILAIGTGGQDLRVTSEDPAGGSIAITFSYYAVTG